MLRHYIRVLCPQALKPIFTKRTSTAFLSPSPSRTDLKLLILPKSLMIWVQGYGQPPKRQKLLKALELRYRWLTSSVRIIQLWIWLKAECLITLYTQARATKNPLPIISSSTTELTSLALPLLPRLTPQMPWRT